MPTINLLPPRRTVRRISRMVLSSLLTLFLTAGTLPVAAFPVQAMEDGTLAQTAEFGGELPKDAPKDAGTPQLTVMTTADRATVPAGEIVAYMVSYQNTGVAPADTVTLSSALPASTTLVEAAGAIGDADSVMWDVGTLSPGASGTVTLRVRVASPITNGTIITNDRTVVTAANHASVMADPVATTVLSGPILTVAGTESADPVLAGDNLTYTFSVENTGTDVATNVTLTDVLPAGTTLAGADGWSTDGVSAAKSLGTIAASSTATAVLTVQTQPGASTAIVNDGYRVAADGLASVTGAPITTMLTSLPGLSLMTSVTPTTVTPGEQITYTVQYTNTGGTDATGVTLNAGIPQNSSFVSATAGGTASSGVVTWNVGTLAPGMSGSVQYAVQVTSPLANGTVIAGATATIDALETAPVTSALPAVTVTSASAATLTVTESADPVAAGSSLTYTLHWTVSGTAPVTDARISMTLPESTHFSSAVQGGVHSGAASGGTVVWNLGTLSPGTNGDVTVTVQVGSSVANSTQLTALATLAATDLAQISTTTMTAVTAPAVPVPAPLLTVKKSVDHDFANPGDTVQYTVVVRNTGDAAATGVLFTDALPNGFTFTENGTAVKSVALGDLAPNASAVISYTVAIAKNIAAGAYKNLATVKAENHAPVSAGVLLEVRLPVVAVAAVTEKPALALRVQPQRTTVKPGAKLGMTLTVANNGRGDALDVRVRETLPDGVTYADTGSSKRVWVLGTVFAGETRTISFTVRVAENAAAGAGTTTEKLTADNHATRTVHATIDVVVPRVLGATTLADTGVQPSDALMFGTGVLGVIFALLGLLIMRSARIERPALTTAAFSP